MRRFSLGVWSRQAEETSRLVGDIAEFDEAEKSHKIKVYDADARREMDLGVTDHTVDFMQRNAKAGKPFFVYVPLTQPHMPTESSKQFDGKTGNGPFADMLAEMDFNVGRILDAVSALQIQDNTIIIFTSDNGPENTMHLIWQERQYSEVKRLAVPRLIDLYDNPQERWEETLGESAVVTRGWVAHAMFAELAKIQESLKKDPPVPMEASDPYVPPK